MAVSGGRKGTRTPGFLRERENHGMSIMSTPYVWSSYVKAIVNKGGWMFTYSFDWYEEIRISNQELN